MKKQTKAAPASNGAQDELQLTVTKNGKVIGTIEVPPAGIQRITQAATYNGLSVPEIIEESIRFGVTGEGATARFNLPRVSCDITPEQERMEWPLLRSIQATPEPKRVTAITFPAEAMVILQRIQRDHGISIQALAVTAVCEELRFLDQDVREDGSLSGGELEGGFIGVAQRIQKDSKLPASYWNKDCGSQIKGNPGDGNYWDMLKSRGVTPQEMSRDVGGNLKPAIGFVAK